MQFPTACFLLCLSAPPATFAETKLPPPAKVQVDFKQHVQPILAAKCAGCHGSKQQQSGLRLDKRQNALRGGDYGPVIIQGKSAESKLILRLVSGDGGMQMPPTGPLEAEEIGLLRAWIDQGADFGEAELKEEKQKPVEPKLVQLIAAVKARNAQSVKALARRAVVRSQDAGGSTALHHAAAFGTPAIMRQLLDAGADIEAKNRFGQRPLHWAFAHRERTALLLERGASINAQANDGRTALYLAASQRHSEDVVTLLLERGADPNLATTNGRTPLMAASGAGAVNLMRQLIEKADIHAVSGTGSVALMDAASSRSFEAVRMLVDKGANVNARTKRNQTALAMAAMYGSEETVKLLLDRGAEVNVRDERGYSPLMYAAYSEAMPAGVVRMLLAKGADVNVTGEGETPVSLAAKRGDSEVARLLKVPESLRRRGGVATVKPAAEKRTPVMAVEKALTVLARQSPAFLKKSGCNSCHNQYLPAAALALAKERGISAPPVIAELSIEMAERYPERAIDMSVAAIGSVGYELFGFGARRRPADQYTDSVVHYVKAMQTPEGNWQTTGSRPPLTSDDVITTAMAMNILRVYGAAQDKAEIDGRLSRAAAWLASIRPSTTQEHAFRVLGLGWAKAPPAVIEGAVKALVETQRPDGGWAQLPSMGSDAYATGEALYALHVAGKMAVSDAVYQRGMRYLLGTQAEDGSWLVKARSLPVQPYFESGFPYAHDQWISAAGTAWASMALSLSVDPPRMSRR
ncbi:MAG: ankyrin repeat domain-containing protein [Bryobacteraceae bacterium]|nr:ankyrin repeat domain-containing protein [Bryobacteraceae bacterium]